MTTQPTLTPGAFATKWIGVQTTEKAASQEHFIDLCRMLGEPTPHEADPTGEAYAFEKRVTKGGGGDGFADVWKRGFFAWEYKGKTSRPEGRLPAAPALPRGPREPAAAHRQRHRTASRSTPTSPDAQASVEPITLDELAGRQPLSALCTAPRCLRRARGVPPAHRARPDHREGRQAFAEIAQSLRDRGHDPRRRRPLPRPVLFCLFAEDVGLLPKGILARLSHAAARPIRRLHARGSASSSRR